MRVARRAVPAADWVAPGVFSIPIPIEDSDLPYVLVYAISSGDGVLLIDAGWAGEPSLRRLATGLARIGFTLRDVVGVLVTHAHCDHYGLAACIREESGAWIGMHALDAAQADVRYGSADSLGNALEPWLRRCGVPDAELPDMRDATMWTAGEFGVVPVDRMLGNSDVVTIGGRELRVIHTPGHSPGHIVLHMPSEGLLFTGDHVLPHITPNVSAGPLGSVDPLGDYLASLDLLRDLGDILALPAHGWTFSDLDERIETLQGHHLRRLAETLGCLGSAALTTFEVANAMMWSRPLGRYPRFLQRAAIGETEAHLVRLAVTGEVQCEGESPARWSVSAKEAL